MIRAWVNTFGFTSMRFCNKSGHLGFFYSFNNSSIGLFHIPTFAALAASEVFVCISVCSIS